MALRHLIVVAMLVGFAPIVMPFMAAIDQVEAVETVKKKKKKTVQKKPASRPHAGWSEDCLNYYNVHGMLPFWCDKYGRGLGRP